VSPVSSEGTPSGSVQFVIDDVNFGLPVILVDGQAGVTVSGLPAGSHNVTANYTSDSGDWRTAAGRRLKR